MVVVNCALFAPSYAQDALSPGDMVGRWCGETANYVFSPERLIVTTLSDNSKRIMEVDKVNVGKNWVEYVWKYGGNTVFSEFSADKQKMTQAANRGRDKGPRRDFRRC